MLRSPVTCGTGDSVHRLLPHSGSETQTKRIPSAGCVLLLCMRCICMASHMRLQSNAAAFAWRNSTFRIQIHHVAIKDVCDDCSETCQFRGLERNLSCWRWSCRAQRPRLSLPAGFRGHSESLFLDGTWRLKPFQCHLYFHLCCSCLPCEEKLLLILQRADFFRRRASASSKASPLCIPASLSCSVQKAAPSLPSEAVLPSCKEVLSVLLWCIDVSWWCDARGRWLDHSAKDDDSGSSLRSYISVLSLCTSGHGDKGGLMLTHPDWRILHQIFS